MIHEIYQNGQLIETQELPDPPATIYPYDFQKLLTQAQRDVIWNATEPPLTGLAVDLVTIISPMPFGEGSPLRDAVNLLGQLLPGLFTESEVARIIAMNPPE